mmetsp:Transcript_72960/g.225383  ORF Transcript_72960/g.225383 Transcript_72960/m.225383 type:complete len:217 (-) Transcript_72960:406-1056(-)
MNSVCRGGKGEAVLVCCGNDGEAVLVRGRDDGEAVVVRRRDGGEAVVVRRWDGGEAVLVRRAERAASGSVLGHSRGRREGQHRSEVPLPGGLLRPRAGACWRPPTRVCWRPPTGGCWRRGRFICWPVSVGWLPKGRRGQRGGGRRGYGQGARAPEEEVREDGRQPAHPHGNGAGGVRDHGVERARRCDGEHQDHDRGPLEEGDAAEAHLAQEGRLC